MNGTRSQVNPGPPHHRYARTSVRLLKPGRSGPSLPMRDKSKATPWKCQGPTATPRRDPSGLGRGSGRIASPAQRERPPTSASAGEGPRAPNAVPVHEASPLTRRAARAGLSALRALRDPHALPLPPRLRRALARFAGRGNMAAGAAGGKAAWNRPRGVDAFAGATEAAQVRPGVNDPTLTLVALGRPHEQDSGRAGPRVRQPALIAPA